MARRKINLPPFTPVTAGNPTSLNLPVGGNTYERIRIKYTGVTLAQMQNIEVRLNGDPIQEFTDGQNLDDLNDFYGRPATAGYLDIWCIRPELTNIGQRRLTAWGTTNVDTLSIHMDIDAGAAAPVLSADAMIADPRDMDVITKIKQFPVNSGAAAQVEVSELPRGPRIMAAHFFKSDISSLSVWLDGRAYYEETLKADGEALQVANGRVPITARATHVDFMGDDDIGNALITNNARDMRFKPTYGSAGNCNIMVEYLDSVVQG